MHFHFHATFGQFVCWAVAFFLVIFGGFAFNDLCVSQHKSVRAYPKTFGIWAFLFLVVCVGIPIAATF